jgi:DNA-binding response OmpR family regulator
MPPPFLLLITQDVLLATLYGEALSQLGFTVHGFLHPAEAFERLASTRPTAILLDLTPVSLDDSLGYQHLKAQALSQSVPLIGLPTPLEQLARNARLEGILANSTFTPNFQSLRDSLRQFAQDSQKPKPADSSARCLSEISHRIQEMRTSLLAASGASDLAEPLSRLFQQMHHLTLLAGMLDCPAGLQMASAICHLVFDLAQAPAHGRPLLRSVGEAIDLLQTLLCSPQTDGAPPPKAGSVLVVEDDPNASQLICAALELVALSPIPVLTAEDGLRVVGKRPFDLIFLDIGLPSMSGFEFCAALRALPNHQKTPVIFLTGLTGFQNRIQSNLSGGNDFIGKPFNLHELGVKALLWILRH